jgi:hypothetical protein
MTQQSLFAAPGASAEVRQASKTTHRGVASVGLPRARRTDPTRDDLARDGGVEGHATAPRQHATPDADVQSGTAGLAAGIEPGPSRAIPRARSTDPATSHRAAERVRRSGKVQAQRSILAQLVALYPGSTATELARHSMIHHDAVVLGADVTARRYCACRRLPECAGIEARDEGGRERAWWPL